MATDPRGARAVGLRLVPREHGASFMAVHSLVLGIVAGLSAGGRDVAGALLAVAFGALFLPLTAAVSAISHPRFAGAARRRGATLAVLLAIAGALALLHGPARELLVLAGAGALLGGLYTALRIRTGPRSLPTQLAAIAGISALAPLAWLLVAGASPRWELSAPAGFLAFGGTVPYVRERVQRRRATSLGLAERLRGGLAALAWQGAALTAAGVAAMAHVVGPLVPLAFVPGAAKTLVGIGLPESRPEIRRIGYLETAISTAFTLLAGAGLGAAP